MRPVTKVILVLSVVALCVVAIWFVTQKLGTRPPETSNITKGPPAVTATAEPVRRRGLQRSAGYLPALATAPDGPRPRRTRRPGPTPRQRHPLLQCGRGDRRRPSSAGTRGRRRPARTHRPARSRRRRSRGARLDGARLIRRQHLHHRGRRHPDRHLAEGLRRRPLRLGHRGRQRRHQPAGPQDRPADRHSRQVRGREARRSRRRRRRLCAPPPPRPSRSTRSSGTTPSSASPAASTATPPCTRNSTRPTRTSSPRPMPRSASASASACRRREVLGQVFQTSCHGSLRRAVFFWGSSNSSEPRL